MKSRVKPLKPIIPQEFSSKCRITSKQFAFSQTVPRVKSVQSTIPKKTFQDESEPEENEKKSDEKNQTPNENDQKADNQSNNENNESDNKPQNDKDITVIDDYNNEANNEEEEPASQSNSGQKPSSILDDEEMISLKDELMQSHDFSQLDSTKLNQFFRYIKEYTKYTASQADYEEAKKAKNLKDETSAAIYIKKNDKERSDEEKQELEKMKAQQEEKWQKEVNTYDQETAQKLEDLNKSQAQERRDLDDIWNSEKTLRKYRKPSARLLQLWRMEKFLAKTGSFDEAAIIRLEAEELAKREMALAQATANRDYHVEKEKLNQKQNNDLASLVSNREHWRYVMLSRQKTEKDVVVNREAVVEVRQKEPLPKRDPMIPERQRRSLKNQKTRKSATQSTSRSSASSQKSVSRSSEGGDVNDNGCEVKKCQTVKRSRAEIEFNYCTVLPPVASPVTGANTPSDARSTASEKSRSNKGDDDVADYNDY